MDMLRKYRNGLLTVGLVTTIGYLGMQLSGASASFMSLEAEAGIPTDCVEQLADTAASGGSAVKFGGAQCGPVYGAVLPVKYDLATVTGTARYVAPNGNDTTGTGSAAAPFASLGKAVGVAVSGDTILVRGGTYRQGNISIPSTKPLNIRAYPGETPVFNGAQTFGSGWVSEGTFKYHAYTPQPVTDASGISFTTGQNLKGDDVGKHPDQVWVGTTQLKQVVAKSSVINGTFWVDQTNKRLYMTATDVNKGGVEVSSIDKFISINAPGSLLEGLKITRYSNSANDYGVLKVLPTADNTTLRQLDISDTAFIAVSLSGNSDLLKDVTVKNVTVAKSNWMGINPLYTDNLTFDAVKITDMNQFDEFSNSPQSGAIKTSRVRYTKVLNSYFANNRSHGVWFDQSNVDADIANNQFLDNVGSSVFFEISDDLLLINNYIRTTNSNERAVKLAGSSGLKLINNTIVGGRDPIGIYVDMRSKPGCADPSQPLCTNSYGSDRDTVRPLPATLDWMPRLDLMINNIVAYPQAAGYCGTSTTMCITKTNDLAVQPIEKVIHKAESGRGIPQTYINGNIYANGTGNIVNTHIGNYTSVGNFANAMAGAPVYIGGFETIGKHGNTYVQSNGTPTSTLTGLHGNAVAIPTNSNINQYIPAGTKHYGVLNR